MAKKKNDTMGMYDEDLMWMSYRYAIGLKPETENDLFNLDFDTPEYHALVAEFREFLKKKKIKNIPDLLAKDKKDDLIYLSYHYSLGRHTISASMHSGEIARYAYKRMTKERQDFTAHDMRREIYDRLRWGSVNMYVDYNIEDKYCPIDLLMRFLKDNGVDNVRQFRGYKRIEPVEENGELKFVTEWSSEESEMNKYFSPSYSFEDLFCWADVASLFDSKSHKWCKVKHDGREEVIEYFDSWVRDMSQNLYYDDFIKKSKEMAIEKGFEPARMNYSESKELIREIEKVFEIPEHEDNFEYYYNEIDSADRIGIKVYKAYCDYIHPEDFMRYKKIKRCVDKFLANPSLCCYINEDYIVEDNIKKPNIFNTGEKEND